MMQRNTEEDSISSSTLLIMQTRPMTSTFGCSDQEGTLLTSLFLRRKSCPFLSVCCFSVVPTLEVPQLVSFASCKIFLSLSYFFFFLGGTEQIARMLKLAADKKPKFFIEKRKMSDANQAIVDMAAGKPRFRYCLVNEGVEE